MFLRRFATSGRKRGKEKGVLLKNVLGSKRKKEGVLFPPFLPFRYLQPSHFQRGRTETRGKVFFLARGRRRRRRRRVSEKYERGKKLSVSLSKPVSRVSLSLLLATKSETNKRGKKVQFLSSTCLPMIDVKENAPRINPFVAHILLGRKKRKEGRTKEGNNWIVTTCLKSRHAYLHLSHTHTHTHTHTNSSRHKTGQDKKRVLLRPPPPIFLFLSVFSLSFFFTTGRDFLFVRPSPRAHINNPSLGDRNYST